MHRTGVTRGAAAAHTAWARRAEGHQLVLAAMAGLDPRPEPRWDNHGVEQGQNEGAAQPRPPGPGRLRPRLGREDYPVSPGNVGSRRYRERVLESFHPAVRAWFEGRFPAGPTEPQAEGWREIAAGRHTLIAAPTGSGKTLAAFLVCIDRFYRAHDSHAARPVLRA